MRYWGAALRIAIAIVALGVVGATHGAGNTTVVMASDFGRQLAPWMVLGDGGRIDQSTASVDASGRKPVLDFRYELGKGRLPILALPVARGALAGAGVLTFAARPSDLVSLMIVVEEQGGGRWTATVSLPAGRWTPIRLTTGDFVLSADAGDPPDSNDRLDMDKVKVVSLIDAAVFVAATSPDGMRFFGIDAKPRNLQLADVSFLTPDGPTVSSPADALTAFAAPQPMWMMFGVNAFDYAVVAPLKSRGLAVRYERKAGNATSVMRRLPKGLLAGTSALTLAVGSAAKATLLVKLEQANGGKFEAPLDLQGDSLIHELTLRAKDFKKSDDSRKGVDQLDWADVTQLVLVDAPGLFSTRGENRLWLSRIASDAPQRAPIAAPPVATAAAPPTTTTGASTAGWAAWTKRSDSILSGPFSLVGDPSVMRDGPILRMVYNCFDVSRKRGAICEATSTDGIAWADVSTGDSLPGRLIKTRPGEWDDAQETPFMIKFGGEYLLYFVGYRDHGGFFNSFPAHVGFAVSRDGVHFERPILTPVVQTSPGGYDNDAISSPSVVEYQGKLVMLYTAHCWTSCPQGKGMALMSATSTDGRTWVKSDKPVLTKADFPKLKDGMAEAEVDRSPDGDYYLFFTMFYGDDAHEIGVAHAASPFGPWDIDPDPIIRRSKDGFDAVGPIAPSVVFEGNRARMWFHGFSAHKTIEIGYAEAPWPLKLR